MKNVAVWVVCFICGCGSGCCVICGSGFGCCVISGCGFGCCAVAVVVVAMFVVVVLVVVRQCSGCDCCMIDEMLNILHCLHVFIFCENVRLKRP